MIEYIVLVALFWIVWMIGYLIGLNQSNKIRQKPAGNLGVATRRMVDAGVKEYGLYVDGENDDLTRQMIVDVYRAMKNAE